MSFHHKRLNQGKWQKARRKALERANYRSELSGRPGRLEVDHIIPLHKGGKRYAPENLQVLTRSEHCSKTARENIKTPGRIEWLDYIHVLIDKGPG